MVGARGRVALLKGTGVVAVAFALIGITTSSDGLASPTHVTVAKAATHYRYGTLKPKRHGKVCTNAEATGINDDGAKVGEVFCGAAHGFILHDGHETNFYIHGSGVDTIPTDIASDGTVSMFTEEKYEAPYRSYLRALNGKLTKLSDPKAGPVGTQVLAVNGVGEAVGVYYTGLKRIHAHAFIDDRGKFRTFSTGIKGVLSVVLTSVNDNGTLAGQFSDRHNVRHGFIYADHHLLVVNAPSAKNKPGYGTGISSLANDGATYTGAVYTKNATTGFVHRDGHFRKVTYPAGAGTSTFCQGVNERGTVVGYYIRGKRPAESFRAALAG